MQEKHQQEMGNGECGMWKVRSAHSSSEFPIPNSAHRIRRAAFTLTELLVVIAIIAVLAALITAAARRAFVSGNRARVVLEIKNMNGAMENFKNDYGSYPPNAMNYIPGSVPGSPAMLAQNDMVRMFKKAFPHSQEPQGLMLALCGQNTSGTNLEYGMNAEEALVFWLGGFSNDEQFPISGPGGPSYDSKDVEILENRKWRYEFDTGRFYPRNDGGEFDGRTLGPYPVDLNHDGDTNDVGESRKINFWEYTPKGSTKPFLYFDVSRYKPFQYDLGAEFAVPGDDDVAKVYAIKRVREGVATPSTKRDIIFVNAGKFQILHSGLDDIWGTNFGGSMVGNSTDAVPTDLVVYPDGPFIGDPADTLTNFTDGELAAEQENK